jgi:hypothetical protein
MQRRHGGIPWDATSLRLLPGMRASGPPQCTHPPWSFEVCTLIEQARCFMREHGTNSPGPLVARSAPCLPPPVLVWFNPTKRHHATSRSSGLCSAFMILTGGLGLFGGKERQLLLGLRWFDRHGAVGIIIMIRADNCGKGRSAQHGRRGLKIKCLSRRASIPAIKMFQYEICPFCNKIKAVLDFYKAPPPPPPPPPSHSHSPPPPLPPPPLAQDDRTPTTSSYPNHNLPA